MGALSSQPAAASRLNRMQLALVGLILLLGAFLRFAAVAQTVVDRPYRADVSAYYNTAYNLNTYGVYAHSLYVTVGGMVGRPLPDAFVTPGYPLLLTLFVHGPPRPSVFLEVGLWQAIMGSVTLLLVFQLFWRYFGYAAGASTMLLTAISPHQVNTTVFMVTETWFTLLLLLALLVFALHLSGPRRFLPALLATGALFGVAALTRPVVEFFPLLLVAMLFLMYPPRQSLKGGALLLAGFLLVWTPWIARNEITLGRSGDSAVMVNTLTTGMYPDFEYEHNPASLGEPYRWDPRSEEINSSLGSALKEIGRRFREHPGEELEWYLVGKPVTLWSWELTEGGWDTYIYPVLKTPYETNPAFRVTHAIAYLLHWPLVILAFLTSFYVWSSRARRWLDGAPLVMARVTGLLLFYNTAVLMVLSPFVRYSIPFLPLVFGMAALGVALGARWVAERRLSSAAEA